MSKYTWSEMELCKECHYKNKNPDLCNYTNPPLEKPCPMNFINMGCGGRFLRESKWKRMNDAESSVKK